jgi:hypothetical protein
MRVKSAQIACQLGRPSCCKKILFRLILLLILPGALLAQVSNPAMPDSSMGEKLADLRIGAYLDVYEALLRFLIL